MTKEPRNSKQTLLFHCTNSDSLNCILKSQYFRYSYCLEPHVIPNNRGKFCIQNFAFAMVCFADLLEDELERHMKQFHSDSFIIMEKQWAMNNRISPVLYYYDKSLSLLAIKGIIKQIDFSSENLLMKSTELLMPFLKPYQGKYFLKCTNKESNEIVQFYLEREWRSFPFITDRKRLFLTEKEFLDEKFRDINTKEIEASYRLSFAWENIHKIGCPNEKKDEIVQTIKDTFHISTEEALDKIINWEVKNNIN